MRPCLSRQILLKSEVCSYQQQHLQVTVSGHEQKCYPEKQQMKARFKADGNVLALKYRQYNDVWKHAIRLELFVRSWGINMVPGHSEI